jgi:hypothetical protein
MRTWQVMVAAVISGCSAGAGGSLQPPGGSGGIAGGGASLSGGAAGAGGHGTGGGSVPAAPWTEAEACLRYTEAWCRRQVRCGTQRDVRDCMLSGGSACPDLFFADGSLRTVAGMLTCADTWEAWPCSVGAPPPCASPGTRAHGEPCIGVAQCEGWCRGGGTACGQCVARAGLGESCIDSGFCEVGLDCDEHFVCVELGTPAPDPPLPGPGEPCFNDLCRAHAYCGMGGSGSAECHPLPGPEVSRPAPGQPCEYRGVPCAEGFTCGCLVWPCAAADFHCIDVRGVREPCGSPGALCHDLATCTGGTCVANVSPGAFEELCGG